MPTLDTHKVDRISAFSFNGAGGNPAGVMITDTLPEDAQMQAIAADIGYSETVFAKPTESGFRVRYFAPEGEVAFCGHATIALGAALGATFGAGQYDLALNSGDISVEAFDSDGQWGAKLVSPPTHYTALPEKMLLQVLDLFGWGAGDLDSNIAPSLIHGGADHLLLALRDQSLLQNMSYDFDAGAKFMQDAGLVTINLIWRENEATIHSRNPFAGHGVYEDPATGAAAAAMAGYLRDTDVQNTPFEIMQGTDMGVPSRLEVAPRQGKGAPIEITGQTRKISE